MIAFKRVNSKLCLVLEDPTLELRFPFLNFSFSSLPVFRSQTSIPKLCQISSKLHPHTARCLFIVFNKTLIISLHQNVLVPVYHGLISRGPLGLSTEYDGIIDFMDESNNLGAISQTNIQVSLRVAYLDIL